MQRIGKVRLALLCLAGMASMGLAGVAPAASAASPPLLWQSGQNCGDQLKLFLRECGDAAGETLQPRGIVADPTTGFIYVLERVNGRLDEFSPWGVFRRAWGWGVVDGSAEAQECGPAASPPTSTCRHGLPGGGPGQFAGGLIEGSGNGSPTALARDETGNLYVYETSGCWGGSSCVPAVLANRVQKLDSEGNFILAFGAEVNLTKVALREEQEANSEPVTVTPTEENLCTAVSGNECGPGIPGSAPGEFGSGALSALEPTVNQPLAIGPGPIIYVGGQERVQEFNPNGEYLGSLPLPGKAVRALAVDSVGDLYLVYTDSGEKTGLDKLSPSGSPLCTIGVDTPRAVAIGDSGTVYVASDPPSSLEPPRINRFDSNCAPIDAGVGFGADLLTGIDGGLATSSACGIQGDQVLTLNTRYTEDFVAAFGPPPDATICPPPAVPPRITDQYAASVENTRATVRAKISPAFWPDTRYYVEYGPGKCSEGGCQAEPVPPGRLLTSATTNAGLTTAGVTLRDLTPRTTYHYRFVAGSGGGTAYGTEAIFRTFLPSSDARTDCPNQAFRTGAARTLPDCRAYEMVSPPDKNGGDVESAKTATFQASESGDRFAFTSSKAFAGSESATVQSQYLATRDPAIGWQTAAISPPRASVSLYEVGVASGAHKAFSADLCSGWVLQDTAVPLTPNSPANVPNLYRRNLCAGGYELLTSVPPPGFSPDINGYVLYYPEIQGFAADGTRSVFRANAVLTPSATKLNGLYQVYLAYDGGKKLRLVSVLPDGSAATKTSSVGTLQGTDKELAVEYASVAGAVSVDGSRVFWSLQNNAATEYPHTNEEVGKLYLRVNATEGQSRVSGGSCTEAAKACTIPVSEAPNSRFLAGDPAGTKALYTVGDLIGGKADLYAFSAAAGSSRLIAGKVTGYMGASKNLSRVYFTSAEVLTGSAENSNGDEAVAGASNLYLYDAAADSFTFVGTVRDHENGYSSIKEHRPGPLSLYPYTRTSRVSPDGTTAAFTSVTELTGYDNTDISSGEPDAQVFVFDAEGRGGAGELLCVSCSPTGKRSQGKEVVSRSGANSPGLWVAATLPGWVRQTHPGRALAESGDRIFFNAYDALATGDTNGVADVYQWEAAGSGDCTAQSAAFSPSNGGCISLISSGESAKDSEFFDATPSGSDVFFRTQSSLVVQDPGLRDVYDARVDGGFPPPVEPAPACEGEACQGLVSPPDDPTPASAAFQGAGNVRAEANSPRPRCGKGKTRRKGRCVKASKKQKKVAKQGRAKAGRRAAR